MNSNILNYKKTLFYILFFTILLKFMYISICAYSGTVYFVGPDAWGIFIHSIEVYNYIILNKGEPTRTISQQDILYIYYTFLGFLNTITFSNYITAALISVFVWLLSFLLLYKSMILLNFKKNLIIIATFFYCFTPSIFIFTSTTLREVWQLFFINLMLFIFLKINTKNSIQFTIFFYLLLILSWISLFILHKALFFAGFFFIFFILFFKFLPLLKNFLLNPIYFTFTVFLLCTILYYFYSLLLNSSLSFSELKYGLPKGISEYQNGLVTSSYIWDQSDPSNKILIEKRVPRSTYGSIVEIQNYLDLLLFVPIAFAKYLFEPIFSLNKVVIKDMIAIMENILRFVFIFIILLKLVKFKLKIFLLFIIYLLIECVWSLGTANWGTALRHHIPTWGLLILCAFYALNNILKEKI